MGAAIVNERLFGRIAWTIVSYVNPTLPRGTQLSESTMRGTVTKPAAFRPAASIDAFVIPNNIQ